MTMGTTGAGAKTVVKYSQRPETVGLHGAKSVEEKKKQMQKKNGKKQGKKVKMVYKWRMFKEHVVTPWIYAPR